jgi:hypothetical protein
VESLVQVEETSLAAQHKKAYQGNRQGQEDHHDPILVGEGDKIADHIQDVGRKEEHREDLVAGDLVAGDPVVEGLAEDLAGDLAVGFDAVGPELGE